MAAIARDVPTVNLDNKNIKIVFDILRQIAHEIGQIIIAVTHDNDFAEFSDRTIELAAEKIIRGTEGYVEVL